MQRRESHVEARVGSRRVHPTGERGAATSPRIPRLLCAVALAAALAELWLAWSTHGTNDVDAFRQYADERVRLGAVATYAQDPDFNHPPFVFPFLLGLRWIAGVTGLPFGFCLRLPGILANLGSFFLVARLFAARLSSPAVVASVALMSAAPVAIMIAGFHGNTDPLMIFCVLLSVYWIERPGGLWWAGAAMGMSMNFKVVPLVFWPVIFLSITSWRRRAEYFGAALAVVVLASTPVLFEAPALVARKVFGYSSDYGVWGLAWFLLHGERALPALNHFFRHFGRPLLALLLIGLSLWMDRRRPKPALFRQMGVIAFAFLTFTPGFAVQYLAWLVPWIAGIPVWTALTFSAASGAFLFLVYTCWCQGLPAEVGVPHGLDSTFWSRGWPWDAAHANLLALWRGPIAAYGLACWISVVLVLAIQIRSIVRARADLDRE
jgi:hypothetical protein